MIAPFASQWMTARQFLHEDQRRAALGAARDAAAVSGYRGRVSFEWDTLHGRRRHLVKVKIYPR